LALGIVSARLQGACGHAPSPKLRRKPKILAPHGQGGQARQNSSLLNAHLVSRKGAKAAKMGLFLDFADQVFFIFY
jgi:hypothetical protein